MTVQIRWNYQKADRVVPACLLETAELQRLLNAGFEGFGCTDVEAVKAKHIVSQWLEDNETSAFDSTLSNDERLNFS
jgi:hypothetical protein